MGQNYINSGTFSSDPNTGRRPPGRKPGVPNKNTAIVKNMFMNVFQALQNDPAYAKVSLIQWAQDEPTEFYKLTSKLFPLEIEAKVRQVITVKLLEEDEEEDSPDEDDEYIEEVEFEDISPNDLI